MQGIFFEMQKQTIDSIDILPASKSEEIMEEIKQFWGLKDKFKQHGFLHKRGILVHGPQGTGKTTALNLAVREIIHLGGIAVFSRRPHDLIGGLNIIREVEPDRPIVVLIEDLDDLIRYDEEEVLALLDGESQIENVVFIATTNYIEKLPQRIVNRPSRFDAIIEIGLPDESIRSAFLMNKIHTTEGPNGEDLVALTEGFSISHIKELIIGVYCQDRPVEMVINKLRTMNGGDVAMLHEKSDNSPRLMRQAEVKAYAKSKEIIGNIQKSGTIPQWDSNEGDFLRRAIAAEADAINLYLKQAEKSQSEFIKKGLTHLAEEEKVHLSELQMMLEQIDVGQVIAKEEARAHVSEMNKEVE